jgi:hypothetical protein
MARVTLYLHARARARERERERERETPIIYGDIPPGNVADLAIRRKENKSPRKALLSFPRNWTASLRRGASRRPQWRFTVDGPRHGAVE